VRARTDEQIVEREQSLAIIESCLGERHAANARSAVEDRCNRPGASIGQEGEQHAVKSLRVGVHAEEGTLQRVLRDVGDEPVLPNGQHDIVLAERIRRHQIAVDDVPRDAHVRRAMDERDRTFVRRVFAFVFAEVSRSLGRVLDVEASLAARVEAGDELLEPRSSRDDDDTVVHLTPLRRLRDQLRE